MDRDCPDNRACINNQCLDPCIIDDPCGKNAQCQTTSHRPVCRCPNGWAGDPHTECFQCRFLKSFETSLILKDLFLLLQMNVKSTEIVLQTKHVNKMNVSIHVSQLVVAQEQIVKLTFTLQFAFVHQAFKEILLLPALKQDAVAIQIVPLTRSVTT